MKISQDAAQKLVRKKRILVEWVSCRVKLREDLQRCYRCWEAGHLATSCKGPDKSGLCFKCGKAGHQKSSGPVEQCAGEEGLEERFTDVENSATQCK